MTAAPSPPRPLPSSTLTLLLFTFATARSSFMSPLKSPTTTELGPEPTGKLVAVPNRAGGMLAKSKAPLGNMSEAPPLGMSEEPPPTMSKPHASLFGQRGTRKGSQMEVQLRDESRLAMAT